LREFSRSRAADWLAGARSALLALTRESEAVGVVGQSMGGALATVLADDEVTVKALVLLVPYFVLSPPAARLARLHRAASLVMPYVRTGAEASILDPAARRAALGFGTATPRLLSELQTVAGRAAASARRVRQPTLVLHAGQDTRIPEHTARTAFERLAASPKELRWFHRSGHVLAADGERAEVAEAVRSWLAQHVTRSEAA
jgi:carboxylesterase